MEIRKALSNEKGLTLIEVLASIVILVIVLGIGMAALAQSSTLTNEIKGESQERQDMQVGLLELTKAVQEAKDIKEGADNTFEITNATTKSKYSLVDGQLISNDEGGQTLVEGVRKMTVVNGKGITLEVNDLEEPVVLARRGGGVIETGLGAPVEEEEPYSDIVCLRPDQVKVDKGEKAKDFSGYPQFKQIAEKNHAWSGESISCDTTSGTLKIRYEVKVALTNGGIRIKTNKLIIDQFANLSVSNGGIFLSTPKVVVEMDQKSNIKSNGLIINGDLISTNINTTIQSEKGTTIFGKLTSNLNSTYISKENFYIKGPISSLNNNVNITSYGDIFIDNKVNIDFQGKITSYKSIFINGSIETKNNETVISSELDIVILGDVNNKFKSKMNSGRSIFINGNLNNDNNEPELTSKKDIVIYGKVTNNQKSVITSGSSLYIGDSLQLGRENVLTMSNNLYVQNGLSIVESAKINVNNDSFINETIKLPTSLTSGEHAFFQTKGKLTYTNITGVETKTSGFKVLVAGRKHQVSSINILPSIPETPKLPIPPKLPKL